MTRQVTPRMTHVGAVQLADAVVRQTGPRADGLGARLVPQEAQCQLHAQALAPVAIVANAHGSLPAAFGSLHCGRDAQNSTRKFGKKSAIIYFTHQNRRDRMATT